jgi:hypothetical protein
MNTFVCLIAFFAGVGVCTTGFAIGFSVIRFVIWLTERKTENIE